MLKMIYRPTKIHNIRLTLHQKGEHIHSPVNWYVGMVVTKMSWKTDVDYLLYMDLKCLIKVRVILT